VRNAVEAKPAFGITRDVQAQWIDFMHRSTRVDTEVQARSVRAWEDRQERHQSMWSKLAHDAVGGIGQEPGSQVCQELASGWMDLWDCYLQGDLGVQTSLHRVWAGADIFNRQEVTDLIGAALAWPLRSYFGKAVWARLEEHTRRRPLASLQESARECWRLRSAGQHWWDRTPVATRKSRMGSATLGNIRAAGRHVSVSTWPRCTSWTPKLTSPYRPSSMRRAASIAIRNWTW